MRAAKKYGIVAIVFLVAGSCTPRKAYLAPAYEVTVIDDGGKALSELKVRRYIQDYSHGTGVDYSSEAVTDSAGRTHFDAVSRWISFATESYGCLSEILQSGAHAGCGSYVDVSVDANHFIEAGRREEVVNGHSHLKTLRISLTPCPSGDWQVCAEAINGKTKSTSPGSR